jgi:hypothetical protein
MATILLPPGSREFLRLSNSHEVEYLVIGGHAVNYHGYPRATGDIGIAGVEFSECFRNRVITEIGGVPVNLIGMQDLRANQKASGRLKNLADWEQLD